MGSPSGERQRSEATELVINTRADAAFKVNFNILHSFLFLYKVNFYNIYSKHHHGLEKIFCFLLIFTQSLCHHGIFVICVQALPLIGLFRLKNSFYLMSGNLDQFI